MGEHESKKKLGGWHRLWLLLSFIWLLIVLIIMIVLFPEAEGDYARLAGVMVLILFIPIVALYTFGWALGWVIRGFKKEP